MSELSVIKDWLDELLSDDLFIVDITLTGPRNQQKLRILLDGDKGVTIDKCAEISRKLSSKLDENDIFPGAYQLEVSSPGVDQPLKFERQYRKNVGRQVKIQLKSGSELKGRLESVGADSLQIKTVQKKEESLHKIDFENIQHIKVLVTF